MPPLTVVHVLISLIGIAAGFLVLNGMLKAQRLEGATKIFLAFTVATSVTGFFFPINGVTPALILGALSLLILAVACYALYSRNLSGGWRTAYVVTAVMAQYFNVFVLVVQSFQKVPALKELAPTQSEPPFAAAQGLVLVAFIAVGIVANRRFRGA